MSTNEPPRVLTTRSFSRAAATLPLSCCVAALVLLLGLSACAQRTHGRAASPTFSPLATDLLSDVRKRGTLLIATDANYQPLSYRTPDGGWSGFDVDVGREIARRLGVQAQFLDLSWDVITGGGWNGRWDLNVGSMTITHDRQRVLYFTEPYYYIPAAFLVYKTSPYTKIAQLEGKRVGVGVSTTYQAYLDGHLTLTGENILVEAPAARAIPYQTDQLALQDLALGDGVRLDAVATSLPFASFQILHGQPFRQLGGPLFYEDAAVAIDKSSPFDPKRFYDAVQKAIVDMHKDGTLRRLSMQEFGADLTHK